MIMIMIMNISAGMRSNMPRFQDSQHRPVTISFTYFVYLLTVSERRETCWMADEGIGGLAYSGKIMAPVPFTANVAKVRDIIEKETGIYYDCCLINWYDDGECAVSPMIFLLLEAYEQVLNID